MGSTLRILRFGTKDLQEGEPMNSHCSATASWLMSDGIAAQLMRKIEDESPLPFFTCRRAGFHRYVG
jgi:hypothetical protein